MNIKHGKLLKSLLIIYLFSFGELNNKIINCTEDTKTVQHIVGILVSLVTINLLGYKKITDLLVYAPLMYLVYVLSTKTDCKKNIVIFSLIVYYYLQEIYFEQREDSLKTDPLVSRDIVRRNIDTMNKIRLTTSVIGAAVLISGVVEYYTKKEVQKGGSFDAIRFFTS